MFQVERFSDELLVFMMIKVVMTLHILLSVYLWYVLLLRQTKMESLFSHFLCIPDMSSNKDLIIHLFFNAALAFTLEYFLY